MGIGWLRGAALVAAVVLGASSGLAAARFADEPDGFTTAQDPLSLGVELVNQTCAGGTLVIVGRGDTRPALSAAVVENAQGARYLDTAASCPTIYGPLDEPVPTYVVYLGPFATPGEACGIRMSPEHKGDNVTSLRSGNQTYVKCPCELSVETWPVLTPGMGAPTTLQGMWINQLQGMLVDLHKLRADLDTTGLYDATTEAVVRRIQAFWSLTPDGIVEARTWALIRDRACSSYDY